MDLVEVWLDLAGFASGEKRRPVRLVGLSFSCEDLQPTCRFQFQDMETHRQLSLASDQMIFGSGWVVWAGGLVVGQTWTPLSIVCTTTTFYNGFAFWGSTPKCFYKGFHFVNKIFSLM